MFPVVLICIVVTPGLLAHGDHSHADIYTPTSEDESALHREKISAISAYFKIMRWRRESEEPDLLPEQSLVQFLGGDYNLLAGRMPDISDMNDELTFYLSQQEEVPMRHRASADYYSMMQGIAPKYLDQSQDGSCGSWISPDQVTPDEDKLFAYNTISSNKKKPAGKLINTHFKNARNSKQLLKKVKNVVNKDKAEKILEQIYDIGSEYLSLPYGKDPVKECTKDLTDFTALLALEDTIMKAVKGDKVCPGRLLIDDIRMSFKMALQNLDGLLSDEEFLGRVFSEEEKQDLTSEHTWVKKVSLNPLALLSLKHVRNLITGALRAGDCGDCGCEMTRKKEKLEKSLERMRMVLPEDGHQCGSSFGDIGIEDFNAFSLITELRERKSSLLSEFDIEHIDGIEGIFEIFSTGMDSYFRLPYIGISFSDLPVKQGLWWLATHWLPYDSCEQITQVQRIRSYLELYSQAYYIMDIQAFSRCGLLDPVDLEDTVMMADQSNAIAIYDAFRTYSYEDLTQKLNYGSDEAGSENGYEMILWLTFSTLNTRKLSLDPAFYVLQIGAFEDLTLNGQMNENFEMDCFLKSNKLVEECAICKLFSHQRFQAEQIMGQLMNYDQGRVYPLPYETEGFAEKMRPIIERDSKEMENCEDSLLEQLVRYKESTRAVLESNMMKDAEVFKTYLSYVGVPGMDNIKPQQMIAAFEHINTESDIFNVVGMRLERRGIEEKDLRSTYDDFREFEDKYLGKKSPKSFKQLWESYMQDKDCILMQMGIFKLDHDTKVSAIGSCDSSEEVVEKKSKNKGKTGDAKKSEKKNKGSKNKKSGGKKTKTKGKKPKKS